MSGAAAGLLLALAMPALPQSDAPATTPAPAPSMDAFDLADMPDTPPKAEADIVVRAEIDRYRHKDISDPRFPVETGKAEFGLFGDTKGVVEAEAVEIGSGVVSKRLMFRVKVPM